jgi:GT2 family glycosyltransferase
MSSVLLSDYPNLEIVFFDNGSTDGSVEFVKQKFQSDARLEIIAIPDNCGPAVGYNKAVEYTRGKYILILNNDVELESNSIQELVSAMESDPAIGIAYSRIMFFDRFHIQTVGNLLDLTLCTVPVGINEKDQGQYASVFEPTVPPGSCMIVRRSMIERIGLFDPNYFFYHDDVDLGLRARIAGFKVIYVPSSIAYHADKSTSSSSMERSKINYYSLNSRVGLFTKNFAFESILKNGIPMFVSYVLTLSSLLKEGGILAFQSSFWSIGNFKNDWKRRQFIQKRLRRIPDSELFEYFLDNTLLLSGIKSTPPLKWILGKKSCPIQSLSCSTHTYYRNHKVHI